MPRKSDSIPINNKTLDKRVKVSDDTKELIQWLHEEEKVSMRKLAIQFSVDRKTIANIIYPERYQKQLQENKKNKVHLKYYDKEKHREYMKEHRDHKKELYNQKLIGNEKNQNQSQIRNNNLPNH